MNAIRQILEMSFTFGTDIEPFLITNFNVQSTIGKYHRIKFLNIYCSYISKIHVLMYFICIFLGLVTVCIGLVALAVVFESLKTVHFMMKVHRRLLCCNQPNCKEYAKKDTFTVTFKMKIFE